MKSVIICIAFTAAISISGYAQEESGIRFESDSFSVLLVKAKQEHKLIFIDCYTTWCGPCKWMDKNVYPNDTVADFYNANFICAKIDMEKGGGIELVQRYDIHCYPTYLFIDSTGAVVHRTSGAQKVPAFVALGKEALTPEDQFATYQSAYDAKKLTPSQFVAYMAMRQATCLSVESEIDGYFAGDTAGLAESPYTWILLRDFTFPPHSVACRYLISHREYFESHHTPDSVSTILKRSYGNAMFKCLYRKDEGTDTATYQQLRRELNEQHFPFSVRLSLGMDMFYYQALGDWTTYAGTAVIYVHEYASADPFMLNNIAWTFYEHIDDTVMLDSALSWAKVAVALDPNYYYVDTYAAVLYKRGRNAEAEVQAKRAIALAREANDDPEAKKNGYPPIDYSVTEELLEKITSGK